LGRVSEAGCVGAGDSPAQLGSLEYGFGLSPHPPIVSSGFHQPSPNWILQHVCHLGSEALVATKHVIERFILPNLALPLESFVYPMSRLALDGVHDLGDGKGTFFIRQW